jgi:hypothetical protein
MSDLILYIPNHGYANDTPVIASWDSTIYYIADTTANSFKLALTSGGTDYLQYSTPISGTVRRVVTGLTTITGLEHLEGKTVQVTGDGVYLGTFTVASGSITLPLTIYSYRLGLPYTMKCRTMRVELPNQMNTTQGTIKRLIKLELRYVKSKGGKAGQEYNGVEYLSDYNMTFSTESQDSARLVKGGYHPDGYIVIKSDEPYPMSIISAATTLEVEQ